MRFTIPPHEVWKVICITVIAVMVVLIALHTHAI